MFYRSNGQFPEAEAPNPAGLLVPIIYDVNGAYPEPRVNPAAHILKSTLYCDLCTVTALGH
jgi:hypothetical protein